MTGDWQSSQKRTSYRALAHMELQRARVTLLTELARPLPSVAGDRVQLQQVVLNLVMNGIKAMNTIEERRREMVIQSYEAEIEQICVAVQDSGVGQDSEKFERLFDAFYTIKSEGLTKPFNDEALLDAVRQASTRSLRGPGSIPAEKP